MRRLPTIAVAILSSVFTAAVPVLGGIEEHLKQITSVDPATVSEADCASSVSKANLLNAADLFRASAVCHALRKEVEGNFLLSAAQVRATADMSLMPPAAKEDVQAMTALYGFIFYHAGGFGTEEVFRDASARATFFDLFDQWSPILSDGYFPGWKVGKHPDDGSYRQGALEVKAHRRQQLVDIARLLSDDDYYKLHRQFSELQERKSGTYVEGSSDATLAADLQERMAARARALGVGTGSPAGDGEWDREKMPPSAPGPEETVVDLRGNAVVKQCSEWAEKMALMSASKIVRVAITTGSRWGVVWRADIASSDEPPEMTRFICTHDGTLSESGDAMERPPLP